MPTYAIPGKTYGISGVMPRREALVQQLAQTGGDGSCGANRRSRGSPTSRFLEKGMVLGQATLTSLAAGMLPLRAPQFKHTHSRMNSIVTAKTEFRQLVTLLNGMLCGDGGRMHIGSVLLVIWLIIGAFAAGQRGYYNGPVSNCTKASTIAVTILAGPLNYAGANPKISCTVPQPSR
jgi:hypothetical protein